MVDCIYRPELTTCAFWHTPCTCCRSLAKAEPDERVRVLALEYAKVCETLVLMRRDLTYGWISAIEFSDTLNRWIELRQALEEAREEIEHGNS